ncbi:MAG TPA: hypothetical protein VMZ90_03535 [Vicinamibacterales bacterium]|nr:hypothetical protein [Vicinamibacterales bacterium]
MQRKALIVFLTLLFAAPLYGQPNRSQQIGDLLRTKYAGQLTGNDDQRRIVLRGLCQDLNAPTLDNGNWGLLQKNDQGGKIPADILVWYPTKEHFDVLTDFTAGDFHNHGVIPPSWGWLECGAAPVPPPPVGSGGTVPLPPGTGAFDFGFLEWRQRTEARQMEMHNQLLIANVKIDALAVKLEQHDNEPGWAKQFFGNRGTQIIAAIIATIETTRRVTKE